MLTFFESIDIELWDIIENKYTQPIKMNSNGEIIPTPIIKRVG
jgi:hypothetical protein